MVVLLNKLLVILLCHFALFLLNGFQLSIIILVEEGPAKLFPKLVQRTLQ